MTINTICYKNFRNIEDATLHLHPEMNLFFGKNAQGKTNALEGICLLASGRSYRTGKEREFIREGEDSAHIMAEIENNKRQYTLEMSFYRGETSSKTGSSKTGSSKTGSFKTGSFKTRKKCLVNGIPVRKMSEFISVLRVVTFFPEHLSIVREGPAMRRNFLDSAISQIDRKYMQDLQSYNSVMEQRNSLLPLYFTDRKTFDETIGIWNEQMAVLWSKIAVRREQYLKELQIYAHDAVYKMSNGQEELSFDYRSPIEVETCRDALKSALEREAALGSSQYGAHREDFIIRLNDKPARNFASQGQCKSIAVALKVAEAQLNNFAFFEEPIVLLDDVLSELDDVRRRYLLFNFPGLKGDPKPNFRRDRQVIITSCDSRFSEVKPGRGKRFLVEAGKYTEI